jgi:4-diphosphocytidyl-2-C-methyl-D-erythritol kinase
MIIFPNCKINLGLSVVSKRDDGYHNIETLFYPIPFYDVLEVINDNQPSNQEVQLSTSGKIIQGEEEKNLCIKAYRLLKKDFPEIPAISIHLHKNIPMGAGLGGGSSDGAYMIKLLNEKFNLGLDSIKMKSYALQLGSDCPFFIDNKPAFAEGRGEILHEVDIDLSGYGIILINPGIHVSTADAFRNISPSAAAHPYSEIINLPVNQWKDSLFNDFEKPVFEIHPAIQEIKEKLYTAGARYASMTGTGSTVYGIFEGTIPENIIPENDYEIILVQNGKSRRL